MAELIVFKGWGGRKSPFVSEVVSSCCESVAENVVKELEENLNMLEEIEGYLKIVRSFPLVSLNFLRKLKVIHGKKLDSGKYVLIEALGGGSRCAGALMSS